MRNQVQLITYPDSLGGGLASLAMLLEGRLSGLFPGGVHILPPFPSSGDRGFAPLTYDQIDPAFGTWDDMRRINKAIPVMLDLMVNHMSRQAVPVQEYLANGQLSPYADLFLTPDKVWPGRSPTMEDTEKLFLRRPTPFSRYKVGAAGDEVLLWTTFGRQDPSEQVDLDVRSAAYRAYMTDALDGFHRRGIRMLRLDAVGYVVKKPGTSCFFVEPEIYDYLGWIQGLAEERGITLLPEVHAPPAVQQALAAHGFPVYDFVLPYAILESLLTSEAGLLRTHLSQCPAGQVTMLDCHDGIPVKPDLDGLYQPHRARAVVDACLERGANLSRIVSLAHRDPDGFDVHQVRCSYYSALGENDDAYIAARALQLFAPGIPQVYYAGLLAGRNDTAAVRRTGEGREINRRNYSLPEVEEQLGRSVVQRLLRLLRLRNEHPAFNGAFRMPPSAPREVCLEWRSAAGSCTLTVDLLSCAARVEQRDGVGRASSENL